jgi:hypothetical protein
MPWDINAVDLHGPHFAAWTDEEMKQTLGCITHAIPYVNYAFVVAIDFGYLTVVTGLS